MSVFLVTGACGFIGANYVRFLVDTVPDAEIVAIDNLSFSGNEPNLDGVRDRVTFQIADITDIERMLQIYREFEPTYVINFAAESHNDRAIVDPSGFMRTNALGTQVMLECSRLVGVTRHLHVSTIEVYGELPEDQASFNEASPLNAKTPYSAAKAAGDQIVRAYMQTYTDISICMTHCANNYGPFQFPEKLVPLMITNVLRGKKVPIYGDGLQRRDWLHVTDHCRAVQRVLTADIPPVTHAAATDPGALPIYDISARHETTNLWIVSEVLTALGRKPAEWVEHVPDRPNHDRRYLIDPTKLETELGWSPTIDFEKGLAETVQWYVDNEQWWQDILARKGELAFDWASSAAKY